MLRDITRMLHANETALHLQNSKLLREIRNMRKVKEMEEEVGYISLCYNASFCITLQLVKLYRDIQYV